MGKAAGFESAYPTISIVLDVILICGIGSAIMLLLRKTDRQLIQSAIDLIQRFTHLLSKRIHDFWLDLVFFSL